MPTNPQLIEGLQVIVTQLAQQADGHIIQSRIFGNQGFKKLEEKYAEHAEEERGYVIKCIDRLLDLGADVKLGATKDGVVHTDPIEWVKYDLEVSVNGLAYLKGLVELARDDYTTYDILKDYYKDEEEDMYWGEQQLELIEKIGKQNWLVKQL
ncbi:cytochrome b1 [Neocallimastix lanati (nom. inval.)]|uniref:Cytochrome b1 n=1 Tax=Neocallimastix californiae TaxID=1754190 RepID=A0A1Y2CZD2_9FUNG|nr:cytochrome b1 [Neocallimastix sp. JGI-2020a]ORY51705.1 cytochrome b1 [Neocallimastix californiae]|eukprot:ORY51705.1 cytochrome b1 [Neocallimastix californiae]